MNWKYIYLDNTKFIEESNQKLINLLTNESTANKSINQLSDKQLQVKQWRMSASASKQFRWNPHRDKLWHYITDMDLRLVKKRKYIPVVNIAKYRMVVVKSQGDNQGIDNHSNYVQKLQNILPDSWGHEV